MRLSALVLLWGHLAWALPPHTASQLISAARQLVGVEYELGGRLEPDAGVDCQGLLFYAFEHVKACGWRSYSVFPTQTVRSRELGQPVLGLAPVAASALDVSRLEPGDVLFFLSSAENPKEPALTTLDGKPQWVWHTGLYTEGGRFIHAYPPRVEETDLAQWLGSGTFEGVYVLRMTKGPAPVRCRHHRTVVAQPAR